MCTQCTLYSPHWIISASRIKVEVDVGYLPIIVCYWNFLVCQVVSYGWQFLRTKKSLANLNKISLSHAHLIVSQMKLPSDRVLCAGLGPAVILSKLFQIHMYGILNNEHCSVTSNWVSDMIIDLFLILKLNLIQKI